jgi:hypothetical protein
MNNDAQITSVAIQEKTMRFASGLTAVCLCSPRPGTNPAIQTAACGPVFER